MPAATATRPIRSPSADLSIHGYVIRLIKEGRAAWDSDRQSLWRRRPGTEGQRDARRLRAGRPALHRAERWTELQVHGSGVIRHPLPDAGGDRRVLDQA